MQRQIDPQDEVSLQDLNSNDDKVQLTEQNTILYENEMQSESETETKNLPSIRFCSKCGFELIPDSMYCSRCGTKIQQD